MNASESSLSDARETRAPGYRFTIAMMLALVAVVAVVLAGLAAGPGVGILVLLLTVPTACRVLLGWGRWVARREPISTGRLIGLSFDSLLLTMATALWSVIACYTCVLGLFVVLLALDAVLGVGSLNPGLLTNIIAAILCVCTGLVVWTVRGWWTLDAGP